MGKPGGGTHLETGVPEFVFGIKSMRCLVERSNRLLDAGGEEDGLEV